MKKTLKIINELKNKNLIDDYAIGGGIAALFYIEPFLTYDLDIFITLPSKEKEKKLIVLSPIFDYLKKKGYSWKEEHIIVEGIPVQFIPADELEEEAMNNAKTIEYEGIETKVVNPEYLIAILIRAGRKKDLEKVEKLLVQTEIDKKKLNDILHCYGLKKKFKFKL